MEKTKISTSKPKTRLIRLNEVLSRTGYGRTSIYRKMGEGTFPKCLKLGGPINDQTKLDSRAIAWMIYLNDVEEGGETEFLYQQKRFKPTGNTALLWPGSWTHIHRGNPPLSGDKYILTGWYTPITSMPRFEV